MNNPDDDGLFDPNRSSAILSDNLHIIENIMFVGLFLFFVTLGCYCMSQKYRLKANDIDIKKCTLQCAIAFIILSFVTCISYLPLFIVSDDDLAVSESYMAYLPILTQSIILLASIWYMFKQRKKYLSKNLKAKEKGVKIDKTL